MYSLSKVLGVFRSSVYITSDTGTFSELSRSACIRPSSGGQLHL